MTRLPPSRFFELLAVLREHDVDFVLIGGFALAFHGAPRATKDIDVVPEPSPANLTQLWQALASVGAEPGGLEDFREEELPVHWSLEGLIEGGGNWIVNTDLGRVDVMQWVAGVEDYDALRRNAVEANVPEVGHPIWVAGFDDLVTMKEEAGRDQDRIDITALRMARGLEE
jgi:hypothetical protein